MILDKKEKKNARMNYSYEMTYDHSSFFVTVFSFSCLALCELQISRTASAQTALDRQ